MKIVHLCLGAFFPDNYSYQENMLPKFHKKMGYDVEVIASLESFDQNGQTCYLSNSGYYINENGIKVCRLKYSFPEVINHRFKHYQGVYNALCAANPDIIFIHNCQFTSMHSVVKYLKNKKNVKVYVDNHVDYSNSGKNWLSRNILHKILWKKISHTIEPYVTKFYGVLPARVDWLINVYKLPKEKCELLVMGADDEKVLEAKQIEIKEFIRKKYKVNEDDFLIMTGGKIDPWKTQTLLLMDAVANIKNSKVKLIVFGSVTPDLKEKINKHCINNKIQYIGWVDSAESYKYFASADLVVFPGRHSVFWEQVAGLGIPMLCKYWDGTTHIDLGGNVEFLTEDSSSEIQNKIENLINCPEKYKKMKEVASKKGMEVFSYRKISERAVS